MAKLFTLFLFLLGFQFAFGQGNVPHDTVTQLEEVVVSYQAIKVTPVTYQNITSTELDKVSVGQEPSFVLAQTPSITAYSDAGNTQGYSYFRLRGIDQTRVNVSLDGMPLNEPEDQGAYFSNYPDLLNSISKIQIQRGVGTSKNGVASYAGSIELFSPALYDSTRATFGIGYGSFNSFRAFAEYNSGVKNRKALYIRASEVYSEGYKHHASNHSQSVFLSSALFAKKSIWKMNLLAGNQQNRLAWLGVPDSLITRDRRTNLNENERDRFTQCLAQLQNKWALNGSSSILTSVYYAFQNGNYDFNLNSFLGLPSTSELYNYAFQSNMVGLFSNYTFTKKGLNWVSGIHGNVYARRHRGSEKLLGELYENTGHKYEVSAFSKAEYSIKRFVFFADLQYRYVTFSYDGAVALEMLDWNFVNPKAGLSLTLSKKALLYYSVGRTGREPTRNDVFMGNDDLLADSLGNPIIANTDAEYVIDHEFGFRYQAPKLNLSANAFFMGFRNEIVLDGKFGPNGLALTNKVEQSYRTGVELVLQYIINKHFSLTNNSAYNYSRIKEQQESFTPILTPAIIINQDVTYQLKGFSATLSMRYQSKSFIDYANTASLSPYFLLNTRLGYEIKRFNFAVFVNNITNAKYYNHGYVDYDGSNKYFVQAPVNFYLSVNYSF